jgi:transcriptional regulator with XRE-family HTH domain
MELTFLVPDGKENKRCGIGNEVMRLRIIPGRMVFYKGEIEMNEKQAEVLGGLLRAKRQELGYSTYQLAEAAGVNNSTVVRIELGRFAAPSPDKLAKFAKALGMNLGEIFVKAGYVVPDELPDLDAYLSTKYPDLSKSDLRKMQLALKELRSN